MSRQRRAKPDGPLGNQLDDTEFYASTSVPKARARTFPSGAKIAAPKGVSSPETPYCFQAALTLDDLQIVL
jgi:hypothetical protein